jgi:hypothetical protein
MSEGVAAATGCAQDWGTSTRRLVRQIAPQFTLRGFSPCENLLLWAGRGNLLMALSVCAWSLRRSAAWSPSVALPPRSGRSAP